MHLKEVSVLLILQATWIQGLQSPKDPNKILPVSSNRRTFFQTVTGAATSPLWLPVPRSLAEEVGPPEAKTIATTSVQAYRVLPDATEALSPSLQSVEDWPALVQQLAHDGGALWLGEHHNSKADHQVQAKLIRDLALQGGSGNKQPLLAIGLEQVQVQYQPILDAFVAKQLSLEELRFLVQWDTRWAWPSEAYQDVFATAQELGLPLIALNVNSEDLDLVDQGGLPALPPATLRRYIADPAGFAQFAARPDFRTYVDYVIRPSYDLHLELGLLQSNNRPARYPKGAYTDVSVDAGTTNMPFRNFFSGRVLWDETMATRAHAWTQAHPGGLLVGLVGADHVKFGNGVPGRYRRLASSSSSSCTSILINPTVVDSRPAGAFLGTAAGPKPSTTMALQLRYVKEGIDRNSDERFLPSSTGGVLPLADYLLFGPQR